MKLPTEVKGEESLPSTGFMAASWSNVATHPAAPAKEKTTATCKARRGWMTQGDPRVKGSGCDKTQQGGEILVASLKDGNPLLLDSCWEKPGYLLPLTYYGHQSTFHSYHIKARKSLREQPRFHQPRWLWGQMQLMPQIGSWSTVARGCQHTSPLGGAHEGQATRSPPQSLNLLPCCPVLPSLSPEPNSCPPRLFSQGLNYPTPHPLLCPFTLVLSRLLSLPSLPHNLQPLISLDKRPRPHPHSRVKLLFCPLWHKLPPGNWDPENLRRRIEVPLMSSMGNWVTSHPTQRSRINTWLPRNTQSGQLSVCLYIVRALEVDAREKIKESSGYIRKDTVTIC